MMQCWTHQNERTVPAGYSLAQAGLLVGQGMLVGYLGGRIFYSSLLGSPGLVMGGIAGVTNFVVGRLASNADVKASQGRGQENLQRLVGVWTVSWLAPLLGGLVVKGISVRSCFAYWVAQIIVWSNVRLLDQLEVIGPQTLRFGLLEWATRPRLQVIDATINEDTLREEPTLPQFLEVNDDVLQTVPTLATLCRTGGISTDGVRVVGALEQNASRGSSSLERDFHKAVRNLAYYVQLEADSQKKREYLERIVSLSGGCPQRHVPETYLLIAELAAGARGPKQRVRVRMRSEVQELKRQMFRELQPQFAPESFWSRLFIHEDEAQDVVAFSRGPGQALGFFLGAIDGQDLLVARGHATAGYQQFFQTREAEYGGANEAFWVRAFKARYTPDLLVSFVKDRVASDPGFRNLAQRVICDHLWGLDGYSGDDPLDDILSPYLTELVPIIKGDGSLGTVSSLNDAGVTLLLKITEDFIDDGRIHPTIANSQILMAAS